jgi:hypothetical protein
MAGKIIAAKSAAITAINATGYVTIASTTGWYAGAKGSITAAGQTTRTLVITEVQSATVLGVRFVNDDTTVPGAAAPNYGRSDPTAYNLGTIYQNDQFIFNPNDLPLS